MNGSDIRKKQVFYIHGGDWYETYEDFLNSLRTKNIRDLPRKGYVKWTKRLASDLGEEYEVFMPQMPNAVNAKYEEWKIWFERHFEYLHDDVILIGCSLGAMFFYKYLSENKVPFTIKTAILMAAPAPELLPPGNMTCGGFAYKIADVPQMLKKAGQVSIWHSKDDFVVPYEHALKYKEALPEAQLVTFEDKNHFLVEELPELVELIKAL